MIRRLATRLLNRLFAEMHRDDLVEWPTFLPGDPRHPAMQRAEEARTQLCISATTYFVARAKRAPRLDDVDVDAARQQLMAAARWFVAAENVFRDAIARHA